MQNAECRDRKSAIDIRLLHLCILHSALRPRHLVVGQHGQESHPRADRVAILLGHDARRLRDVTEIVHDPRGEELAQRHATERRVNPRQIEISRGELPGSNLIEIGISAIARTRRVVNRAIVPRCGHGDGTGRTA